MWPLSQRIQWCSKIEPAVSDGDAMGQFRFWRCRLDPVFVITFHGVTCTFCRRADINGKFGIFENVIYDLIYLIICCKLNIFLFGFHYDLFDNWSLRLDENSINHDFKISRDPHSGGWALVLTAWTRRPQAIFLNSDKKYFFELDKNVVDMF